jgi:hypothetical protein
MEATTGDTVPITGLIIEAMVATTAGAMEGSGLASVSKPEKGCGLKCAGVEAPA